MKKSLVALAAVAATGDMAQVTIDGYVDRGYLKTDNSYVGSDSRTVASNAGTTTLGVKYRENIGGGIVVGGQVNTDWADIAGNTQANSLQPSQTSGFANSQSFVDIAGPFGTIRAGVPNSFTLTNATAVATPAFSTGVGSSYSSSFSIANGLGTGSTGYGGVVVAGNAASTAAATGARAIRIANTLQYSSPNMNGLTVHVGYTPQNNNVVGSGSALGAGNTVGVTEYALRYTNGPIDAMYTSIKYEVGSNGVSRAVLTAAGVASNGVVTTTSSIGNTLITGGTTSTQNLLGASYAINNALKLHAGFGNFSSADNANKGKSTDFGATYAMGNFVFMGHIAKVDDQSTTNADRKLTGLGVDYNLSKTARLYVRYDDINYASNLAAFTGSALKRTAVGFSKSF